ncbi:unnamed protein product, partial [Rotaria socialis]
MLLLALCLAYFQP